MPSAPAPTDDGRPPPPRLGVYRRAIRVTTAPGVAEGALEDDVHHFRVRLAHQAGVLRDAGGEAVRTPYSVCPGSIAALRALEGMPLDRVADLPRAERTEQCMHLLDLAGLVARHADVPGRALEYRISVDHDAPLPFARLDRDGQERLVWSIDHGTIRGSRYDGIALAALHHHLPDDPGEREAALLLRRASLISFVRHIDLDARSPGIAPTAPANCYAKQPVRRDAARRNRGTTIDFDAQRRWPLAGH